MAANYNLYKIYKIFSNLKMQEKLPLNVKTSKTGRLKRAFKDPWVRCKFRHSFFLENAGVSDRSRLPWSIH